ncbi:hypothetical protein VIBNISOn1_560134 [Vibrio nigripulchritudo SOn1]|uniref:Uncharacterized protein n=1 Tax=Vibrio nigripulchritudo SOn1 TaxID=1238450 RepID=A0AAV2VVE8_9VIBR|nr:hypothetical protein VIBNISOn1_560134 [Vibrio nigripulchritudo SOn1]
MSYIRHKIYSIKLKLTYIFHADEVESAIFYGKNTYFIFRDVNQIRLKPKIAIGSRRVKKCNEKL